jgi:hypothetical protein
MIISHLRPHAFEICKVAPPDLSYHAGLESDEELQNSQAEHHGEHAHPI